MNDCLLVGQPPVKLRFGHLDFISSLLPRVGLSPGGKAAAEVQLNMPKGGTYATLPRNPVHLLGVKPKESLDSSFVLSNIGIVIWTIWTRCFLLWHRDCWTDQFSQLISLQHQYLKLTPPLQHRCF